MRYICVAEVAMASDAGRPDNAAQPSAGEQPVVDVRPVLLGATVFEVRGGSLMPVWSYSGEPTVVGLVEWLESLPIGDQIMVVSSRMATTLSAIGFFSSVRGGHLVFESRDKETEDA